MLFRYKRFLYGPRYFWIHNFSFPVLKFPGPHEAYSNRIHPSIRIRWYPDCRHIGLLFGKASAKRSQQFNATYRIVGPAFASSDQTIATFRRNVGRNMLRAFGQHVATCCGMLRVENQTSVDAVAQHCCTNLAKRLQHHATSTNVLWKIWPVSDLSSVHCK